MLKLTPDQLSDYLQRSYTAVDGLWFVKAEEVLGFDAALELDNNVWAVMPKIQARKLRALSGLGTGLAALRECFETKLKLDGFGFTSRVDGQALEVTVTGCPWHQKMASSQREHLSPKIGARICPTEYGGWAAEFGCTFEFHGVDRICNGCGTCTLRFRQS